MEPIQRTRRRYQSIPGSTGSDYSTSYWDEDEQSNDLSVKPSFSVKELIKTDPNAKVQITTSGIPFYETLPDGAVRCKIATQFYKLKQNAKTWKKENIVLREGMYFVIYSPTAKLYFLRRVCEGTNPSNLKQYITDKNLYLINP